MERAKGIYSFSHLTFQEYFAAREIIVVRQSSDEALKELVNHLFDSRWREVFLLAVAMSHNAEKLTWLMKEKIDNLFPEDDKLIGYFNWLIQKTQTPLDLSPKDNQAIQKSFEFYTEDNQTLSRIFYLGLDLVFNLNLNFNFNRNLNPDLNLYQNPDLNLYLYLYRNLNLNRNLNRNLYLDIAKKIDSPLYEVLLKQIIQAYPPLPSTSK